MVKISDKFQTLRIDSDDPKTTYNSFTITINHVAQSIFECLQNLLLAIQKLEQQQLLGVGIRFKVFCDLKIELINHITSGKDLLIYIDLMARPLKNIKKKIDDSILKCFENAQKDLQEHITSAEKTISKVMNYHNGDNWVKEIWARAVTNDIEQLQQEKNPIFLKKE